MTNIDDKKPADWERGYRGKPPRRLTLAEVAAKSPQPELTTAEALDELAEVLEEVGAKVTFTRPDQESERRLKNILRDLRQHFAACARIHGAARTQCMDEQMDKVRRHLGSPLGERVTHPTMGMGKVLQAAGHSADRKLLIDFDAHGLKTVRACDVNPTPADELPPQPVDSYQSAAYYDCCGNEDLSHTEPAAAIGEFLYYGDTGPICERIAACAPVTVTAYARVAVAAKDVRAYADWAHEELRERLSEAYGDRDGDHEFWTDEQNRTLRRDLVAVVQRAVDQADIWRCERVAERVYAEADLLEMVASEVGGDEEK